MAPPPWQWSLPPGSAGPSSLAAVPPPWQWSLPPGSGPSSLAVLVPPPWQCWSLLPGSAGPSSLAVLVSPPWQWSLLPGSAGLSSLAVVHPPRCTLSLAASAPSGSIVNRSSRPRLPSRSLRVASRASWAASRAVTPSSSRRHGVTVAVRAALPRTRRCRCRRSTLSTCH